MRDWLKRIRQNAGLSQKDTAQKAGISANYYCYIENGERGEKLPVSTAKKISLALGFEWTKFYEESTNKESA